MNKGKRKSDVSKRMMSTFNCRRDFRVRDEGSSCVLNLSAFSSFSPMERLQFTVMPWLLPVGLHTVL